MEEFLKTEPETFIDKALKKKREQLSALLDSHKSKRE